MLRNTIGLYAIRPQFNNPIFERGKGLSNIAYNSKGQQVINLNIYLLQHNFLSGLIMRLIINVATGKLSELVTYDIRFSAASSSLSDVLLLKIISCKCKLVQFYLFINQLNGILRVVL